MLCCGRRGVALSVDAECERIVLIGGVHEVEAVSLDDEVLGSSERVG